MSKTPFFTVITPTLQRESLLKTCQSLDGQHFRDFQHIIQADSEALNEALVEQISRPGREVYCCGQRHNNGGNTCRRLALEKAVGSYVFFVDDDNYVADDSVLGDIAEALKEAGNPPWGLFPIWRLGGLFYADPPRSCHVDTMNVVLRKDIAYWPNTDAYGTDGILVDDLMERRIPYAAFPSFRPIAIIPKISFCK